MINTSLKRRNSRQFLQDNKCVENQRDISQCDTAGGFWKRTGASTIEDKFNEVLLT